MLINTILTLPFFNAFIAIIICISDDDSKIHANLECYKELYPLHLVFALFGLII